MTLDGEYKQNIERRITDIWPQIFNGSAIFVSGADNAITAGVIGPSITNDGIACIVATNGTLNNVAGVKGELMYKRILNPDAYFRFRINQTASMRFFVGLTDAPNTEMVDNDNVTQNFAGIQFSTSRGDSSFKFIHNSGGTMPAPTDTGIAANSTDIYDFYMWTYKSAAQNKIIMQLVGPTSSFRTSFTTNLPVETTSLRYGVYLKALASSVKSFTAGYMRISQDH